MNGSPNWMTTTGNDAHLAYLKPDTLANADSEEQVYERNNLPYVIPEMREGRDELERMKEIKADQIISLENIKGCIHKPQYL